MSQTVDPDIASSAGTQRDTFPDPEKVLVPKLDERFALSRSQMILLAIGCLFFMYYNYLRLFHSDFWGHVSYGEWMLANGRIPDGELFVRLADGVPVVCTAWLSQVLFALTGRSGDVESFSHLFALTVFSTYLIAAITFFRQTRNWPTAIACCACVLLITFPRHSVIRPEIFGSLCFAALLLLVVSTDSVRNRNPDSTPQPLSRGKFIACLAAVFALFVLWANLHGSFIVGFAVLGSYMLGRAVEVLWKNFDFYQLFNDKLFHQRLIACEVAFAASVLNPYGFDLLIHTLVFPSNPNLKDVFEWYSLDMMSLEGPFTAFSWLLMVVVLRHSRLRVTASDTLMLAIFTAAVCIRVRMISWYGPVVVVVLAPHIEDVLSRLREYYGRRELKPMFEWLAVRSFRQTLVMGLLIWMSFCFSPVSRNLLGGKPRAARHVFTSETPRGVTEYFRENPPQGLIANPQWWGDWIAWDGPQGIEPLMTTNAVHVVPHSVWQDYLAIARGEGGLSERLDRYRINTIVVSKSMQKILLKESRRLPGWETVFEDDISLIVARSNSLPKEPTMDQNSAEKPDDSSTESES